MRLLLWLTRQLGSRGLAVLPSTTLGLFTGILAFCLPSRENQGLIECNHMLPWLTR